MGRGTQDQPVPEFHMTLPDPSVYMDLHSGHNLPLLPYSRVADYYSVNGKQFDEKYKELYKQRLFLNCLITHTIIEKN
jgi:hypothetical protein